nr:inner membrane CreD family protein [Enterovibrio norvegicus]
MELLPLKRPVGSWGAYLRLEDYALLMGSGLLVVVLLTLMFMTRKGKGEEQGEQDLGPYMDSLGDSTRSFCKTD